MEPQMELLLQEEEEEEEEEEWVRPQRWNAATSAGSTPCRVIVHIDLDCFYAQVEMIRNPELRDRPLGVQQKSIVVTCNYAARNLGVKKLMSVKDAKEKCPQLVLVNGEDLTPYRETSYKVTELLGEFCPLVERLGFDENFVDITEMVEKRLKHLQQSRCSTLSVSGHVYNDHAIDLRDRMHLSLIMGSHIAEEFREAIFTRLGLTGCAGVASNKLLAKLVSGAFKPNQQTVLLPESQQELLQSLSGVQKVPGIGFKTAKRLETLGVRTVCDLQAVPPALLEKELGVPVAQRIQKLRYGADDSPVTPSGPPQSFSDEDSFKKCSSEAEVRVKLEELLHSLLDRVHKDGRQPHTVRLTIRQNSSTERWFHRESRQCPIPPHVLQRFGKERSNVVSLLVEILMKLFRKMIDVELPFHLTLLNVCFSNLKELPSSKKGSIGFYLKQTSPSGSAKRLREADDGSQGDGTSSLIQNLNTTRAPKTRRLLEEKKSDIQNPGLPDFYFSPGSIDQEVMKELPEDIQKEIRAERPEALPTEISLGQPSGCSAEKVGGNSPDLNGSRSDLQAGESSTHLVSPHESTPLPTAISKASTTTSEDRSSTKQPGIAFPPHIDAKTFYELPTDVQEELLAQWKSEEPKLTAKSLEKAQRTKGKRNPVASSSQENNLLRYFKPL